MDELDKVDRSGHDGPSPARRFAHSPTRPRSSYILAPSSSFYSPPEPLPARNSNRTEYRLNFLVNVHHLELFFYVAKHGGISSAVRHMPYGIQQPAVSGQILQLEEYLGQKLFHRRPFSLTPAGERLFRFIQPFFENLELVSGELRGHQNKELRLAASTALLREYGPRLLDRVKQHVPELKLILREADQSMAEEYVLAQEVHLAVTELYTKPPSGIQTEVLAELPLVLVVAADAKPKKAKEILAQRTLPLISVSATSALYRAFQDGLRQHGPPWEINIELSTLEMVLTYAAAGYGVGLSVRAPGLEFGPKIQAIDLDDFPRLKIAAFWQEPLAVLPGLFLEEIRKEAQTQLSVPKKPKGGRGQA